MGTTQGRDWLELTPAHFDAGLLPARHRKPEAEGLFSVADVAPPAQPKASPASEVDGQADLFSETP
jgi:hypothetical protein